jgi:AraC-like DNA-binding protein
MHEFTDAGVLIRLAYQAMIAQGIDAGEVLRRIGFSQSQLSNKDLRTPHSAHARFWQVLEEVSGDPDIGLHLGRQVPVFRGQVLEYLFLSSETFGEGLRRAVNYRRLLSDAVHAELGEDANGCVLGPITFEYPIRHTTECVFVGILTFFRAVTEGAFRPTLIRFAHGVGQDLDSYRAIFQCPVEFNAPANYIHFSSEVLALPSSHAEPELLRLHEQVAGEQVARLEKQDFIVKVNRCIGEVLESGEATLENVAARLSLKPRSLRTRLTETDTNFNQLLAEYRCQLAKKLLARTDESIDQIVYLTGFSEPSTFYRAFKRWVGLTPVEYRRQKQEG